MDRLGGDETEAGLFRYVPLTVAVVGLAAGFVWATVPACIGALLGFALMVLTVEGGAALAAGAWLRDRVRPSRREPTAADDDPALPVLAWTVLLGAACAVVAVLGAERHLEGQGWRIAAAGVPFLLMTWAVPASARTAFARRATTTPNVRPAGRRQPILLVVAGLVLAGVGLYVGSGAVDPSRHRALSQAAFGAAVAVVGMVLMARDAFRGRRQED